jgi:hypothetical protein
MSLDASESQQLLATRSAVAAALDQMDALLLRLGLIEEEGAIGDVCPRCHKAGLDEIPGDEGVKLCPHCNANVVGGNVLED